MSTYTIKSKNRVGAGTYFRITHSSTSTQTPMTFGLFMPSRYIGNVENGEKRDNVPVLYWLSGLTCDDTNFAMKAGPQAFIAAEREVSLSDVSNVHLDVFWTNQASQHIFKTLRALRL